MWNISKIKIKIILDSKTIFFKVIHAKYVQIFYFSNRIIVFSLKKKKKL